MIDRKWFPEFGCRCASFGSEKRFGIGVHVLDPHEHGYTLVKRRTPWLELVRCSSCDTHWYVATDTVEADIYFLRLSNEQVSEVIDRDTWPPRFDSLEAVWPP